MKLLLSLLKWDTEEIFIKDDRLKSAFLKIRNVDFLAVGLENGILHTHTDKEEFEMNGERL